ncbi:MAG TPA: ribonuclease J [Alphaproteobacteria bacterium]|nr:ribonuclease J [Alphaproteobacteria bacterium]
MTEHVVDSLVPGDELLFVALGGAGEIGMNLNLYGTRGRWLMVDLGITFGDDETPGVDVVVPDPAFIAAHRDRLDGLVLTHAHEDHIGAVPYLWQQLRCPLYATPFTAEILRAKLTEAGLAAQAPITVIPLSGAFEVGPFKIELVTLTHSIPEPNAVVIRTPFGAVLHTGDWKFDPDPVVGDKADMAGLARLGQEGVLAMICDSTNVFQPGASGSEASLRDHLIEIVGRFETRVAFTSFASNIARIETMAAAAKANNRRAVLVGRALTRMVEAARRTGYLSPDLELLDESEARNLPRREALLICTGSQGEPRGALARIAAQNHPNVKLVAGDAVIFSSRIIPGNERAIHRVVNRLVKHGVEVVSERTDFVHVSGHPARDELIQMYQLVRPRIAVPVHGEARHLAEQAKLAKECQVPEAPVIENGQVLRLAPGRAVIAGRVSSGRLAVDGGRLVPAEGEMLRERRRMMFNGGAVATLVIDPAHNLAAEPRVSLLGLVEQPQDTGLLAKVAAEVRAAFERLSDEHKGDDGKVREAARLVVRRTINAALGRKPVTEIHLVRL